MFIFKEQDQEKICLMNGLDIIRRDDVNVEFKYNGLVLSVTDKCFDEIIFPYIINRTIEAYIASHECIYQSEYTFEGNIIIEICDRNGNFLYHVEDAFIFDAKCQIVAEMMKGNDTFKAACEELHKHADDLLRAVGGEVAPIVDGLRDLIKRLEK